MILGFRSPIWKPYRLFDRSNDSRAEMFTALVGDGPLGLTDGARSCILAPVHRRLARQVGCLLTSRGSFLHFF